MKRGSRRSSRRTSRHGGRASATAALDLSQYGLTGLRTGDPVTLYHGTTANFSEFDLSKSRRELVDQFYGDGIFLTPSKRVARLYASANRNVGLPPSIIDDLAARNRAAGAFMRALYTLGDDAWEVYAHENGFWDDDPPPGVGMLDAEAFEASLGVDPNSLSDISRYIIGSKNRLMAREPSAMDLFFPTSGAPNWLYDTIASVGLDADVYRPKVYTVTATVSRPLVTASQARARRARSQGYDSVVYHGRDLVDDEPEVAVFDPRDVRIDGVEVI